MLDLHYRIAAVYLVQVHDYGHFGHNLNDHYNVISIPEEITNVYVSSLTVYLKM